MEQRVFSMMLRGAFFVSLLYGCYVFHSEDNPGVGALMNFVPAGVLLAADIAQAVVWNVFSDGGRAMLSQVDPITALSLTITGALVLAGIATADPRSERAFSWAFRFATFLAGYQTGKKFGSGKGEVNAHQSSSSPEGKP